MKKLSLLVGMILFLVACDFEKEKEEQNTSNSIVENIFDNELIDRTTYVANVKSGDNIRIQIRGKKLTPQFIESTKNSKSTWKKRVCHRIPDPPCRFPHACFYQEQSSIQPMRSYCKWEKRSGNCQGRYRRKGDLKEIDQVLDPEFKNSRIRLKLGDNLYPLGEVISYGVTTMETLFYVSDEMIRESDELSLVIIPDPEARKIKTGFLGFTSCAGKGKKDFNPHLNRSSKNVSNASRMEYQVDLSIEYEAK